MDRTNKYNLIHTSNLNDHLGLPNIILSSSPLLKEAGKLFTTTLVYRMCAMDEFLKLSFGFDSKMLPVILGYRCINHEGTGYASTVMLEPSPMSIVEISSLKQLKRDLIWEKVHSQPLVFSQLNLAILLMLCLIMCC